MNTSHRLWLACSFLLTVAACGGGGSSSSPTPTTGITTPPVVVLKPAPLPDNRRQSPMTVLWFGNSHTQGNNLPDLVRQLLAQGAGIQAHMEIAPSGNYLDERWVDPGDHQLLRSRPWSALILQAQKYSTTGMYHYSTQAAEDWISLAKMQQTMPVLYPEHPRAGNTEEGERVYQLHKDIAKRQAACVAPIGPVWNALAQTAPQITLHSADGNHTNAHGALLTAYVFYEILSAKKAADLPGIGSLPVPVHEQAALRSAASRVLSMAPACPF